MAVFAGQGTILKMTIATALTPIAQVTEIEGPSIETGTKETTNLASTIKTYRSGLPDTGTISATVQFDPTDPTHNALTTAIQSWPQSPVAWEVDFPTVPPSKAAFSAFVTKYALKGMNEEDNIEADIELKVSGMITLSTGTGP